VGAFQGKEMHFPMDEEITRSSYFGLGTAKLPQFQLRFRRAGPQAEMTIAESQFVYFGIMHYSLKESVRSTNVTI
jgi:hypothetical protein